jgi:hypothetical protein
MMASPVTALKFRKQTQDFDYDFSDRYMMNVSSTTIIRYKMQTNMSV